MHAICTFAVEGMVWIERHSLVIASLVVAVYFDLFFKAIVAALAERLQRHEPKPVHVIRATELPGLHMVSNHRRHSQTAIFAESA